MSNLLAEMKEFKSKNPAHRYCNGYISIGFRSKDADYDINKDNFVLDGGNDGWFRKIDGIAKGYGLAINELKVTSKQFWVVGDFYCFKAKIAYTNWNWNPEDETGLVWVFVHKAFEIEEVLEYIEENKEGWYP